MTTVRFERLQLPKLYPLTISRGTTAVTENLYALVSDGEHEGIGELSPATASDWTASRGERQLADLWPTLGLHKALTPEDLDRVDAAMREANVDPPAMAALDVALWDLLGKQRGQPLYRLFGFPKPTVPTSVTIGINPPEVTRERVPDILRRTGAKCLKIKLGSPEGRDLDRAHFEAAALAAAPFRATLRVDANGGWTLAEAKEMMAWLADRGVDYVEQPLVEGAEDELPILMEGRPMPIYIDESCKTHRDVAKLAGRCDGVNLKLMKCGGPTDALKIIAEARRVGLKLMIGCMSESSIAIAAGAHLSGALDHIDLDSHLNLNPDPAEGAPIVDGVVVPSDEPGHGARLRRA